MISLGLIYPLMVASNGFTAPLVVSIGIAIGDPTISGISFITLHLLLLVQTSPPVFCSSGRTDDGTAIKTIIRKANKFIYISVVDYLPLYIYTSKLRLVKMYHLF